MNTMTTLQNFINSIPILKKAIPADLSIAVCDLEKFIAYYPGKDINLHIRLNQPLKPDEPLSIALRENRALQANVPADFYGFEFIGTATPLHDELGNVIGGVAVQLRRQTELRSIAEKMADALLQANEQIHTISAGSHSLAGFSQQLLTHSIASGAEVRKSEEVLDLIEKVADRTNLIGINAAIEAARVGEKGLGFEVVANEIQRLSNDTASSTKEINETLKNIRQSMDQMKDSIEKIATIGQEQATSITQIVTVIDDIMDMARHLSEYANQL